MISIHRNMLCARLGLAALLALTGPAAFAAGDSADSRFLAGLRDRGLFELAEAYCVGRLESADLDDVRRAELTVELSLTLADRAVNAAPLDRGPFWQRAWGVTEEFAREHAQNPRLPLVRYQGTLGLVARGELARQESELVADNRALVEEARTQLRSAVRGLEALNEDVEQRLRRASTAGRTSAGRGDELSEYQLSTLARNVQYQLARALRNQGQSYPAESADRALALHRALELLDPLAKLDASHPLALKSKLNEIVCYRLLGETGTAARKLAALAEAGPPPPFALRARAEAIRVALAAGNLPQAIEMAHVAEAVAATESADLDYARLETSLAAWSAANDSGKKEEAASWQSKATALVEQIEDAHGPYWTRRAEMLLAGTVRTSSDTGDLALQVRAAESSYRSGRLDDAVAAYDRAQALARQQGDAAASFNLAYTAAAIEHQRNNHEKARDRFRALALAGAAQPKAAEAHLAAVYHAEQIAAGGAVDGLGDYIELLDEHLEHWPKGPTTDPVRWRLGRVRQHQAEWPLALDAYRAVSPDFAQFDRVVDGADGCYRAWLDELTAAGKPTEQVAADGADWFESIVAGPGGELPETWTPTARRAALAAARLRLNHTPSGFGRAEQILSALLAGADDDAAEWQSTARAMLVFSLAGQGRRDEAADTLRQISAGSPQGLLAMIEGLLRVVEAASPEAKTEWAALAVEAADMLRPRQGELEAADQQKLDRLKAQALVHVGRVDEALAAYAWLAKTNPRNADLQEAYAKLLSAGKDRRSLESALARWRELEKGSRPGTDRWFRAKYEVASLHYRLGNRSQTEKMIRLLTVLHPELGGGEMKNRFEKLLDRAQKGGSPP